MQDMDCALEGLHNLAIVLSSELEEGLSLFLEDGSDGLDSVAFYQSSVEGMVDQHRPCLLPVVFQG